MRTKGSRVAWGLLIATRPKTLWAGVCPVVLGIALARSQGVTHLPSAIACLLGAFFIQIGTNYANDYFDFKKGTDTEDRIGPARATQKGFVSPRQMLIAFSSMFLLAACCAGYLTLQRGWVMAALLVISVICGVCYTAGPFPLGYNGLGDVFAFIFFGPVACAGTHFALTGSLDWSAALIGVAPGGFALAMIDVNNIRDMEQDRIAKKRTPVVLFGRTFALSEFIVALSLTVAIPVWAIFNKLAAAPTWGILLVLPLGVHSLIVLKREREGPPLNKVLAMTGIMLLVHTIFFSWGILSS